LFGRGNKQGQSKKQDWTELEDRRLTSWILEFIPDYLLPGTKIRDDAEHRQFDGGLRVVVADGRWFAHTHGIGGSSVLPLIQLYHGLGYAEAVAIGRGWNAAHPGFGASQNIPLDEASEDAEGGVARQVKDQLTETCLAALADLAPGDPEYTYLTEIRGLPPECWPDSVKRLPANVLRYGEGAVASLLYQDGVLAGVQLTHVDLAGKKSVIEPVRRTFRKDRRLHGAAFGRLPDMTTLLGMAKDPKADPLMIAEGTENWLSLRLAFPRHVSIGLPGIGALQHLRLPKGLRVVMVRDGDEQGSTPDRGLIAGLDALLLQNVDARVTVTPPDDDANSILLRDGVEALHRLVQDAGPVKLSEDGEIEQVSRLPRFAYDQGRRALAKKLNVRVDTLDDMVKQRQRTRQQATAPGSTPSRWSGVIDPNAAGNALLAVLGRHIRTDIHRRVVLTVWAFHAHLAVTATVNMPRSPRLHVASGLPGAGKTTVHIIQKVCPRPASSSSTTGSAIFRLLGNAEELPVLLVDEADLQMAKADSDVLAVLDAGDTRATAFVRRSVRNPLTDEYESVAFPVFSPACLFGLHNLTPQLEERSIRVVLLRPSNKNRPARLNKASLEELADINLHLVAWAATEPEWEPPETELAWLDEQTPRVADNWDILYRTAERMGGEWPQRVKDAALAILGTTRHLHPSERLLADIYDILEKQRRPDYKLPPAQWPADCYDRIQSSALLTRLLADQHAEYQRCNHGGRIGYEWLSNRLDTLLRDGRPKRWHAGKESCRGYLRSQFEEMWAEIGIGPVASSFPPDTPEEPDQPDTDPPKEPVVSGWSGFPGMHGEANSPANGEDAEASGIIAGLIRRSPGRSDASIAKAARRSRSEVAAVRAAMKAGENPA
jgi:hypothetical protein